MIISLAYSAELKTVNKDYTDHQSFDKVFICRKCRVFICYHQIFISKIFTHGDIINIVSESLSEHLGPRLDYKQHRKSFINQYHFYLC